MLYNYEIADGDNKGTLVQYNVEMAARGETSDGSYYDYELQAWVSPRK